MSSSKTELDLSTFGRSQAQTADGDVVFDGVFILYAGSTPKEHFPLKRTASGDKIEKPKNAQHGQYDKYEREEKSDGWSVGFIAENGQSCHLLFSSAPELEIGMYALVGTGSGQRYAPNLPMWVTQITSLTEVAALTKIDSKQVYGTQGGEDL